MVVLNPHVFNLTGQLESKPPEFSTLAATDLQIATGGALGIRNFGSGLFCCLPRRTDKLVNRVSRKMKSAVCLSADLSIFFWREKSTDLKSVDMSTNEQICFFSADRITPCKQVPPPVFFQFFHNPHRRSPIQFKKIRSATRSKLSAQGSGIQRSHYTTLWDSAQAIC